MFLMRMKLLTQLFISTVSLTCYAYPVYLHQQLSMLTT